MFAVLILIFSLDNGTTALFLAIDCKHYELAKYLVYHGADVNKGPNGLSPLAKAALGGGNKEFVSFLLGNGANPNVVLNNNKTLLECLKEYGDGLKVYNLIQEAAKQCSEKKSD